MLIRLFFWFIVFFFLFRFIFRFVLPLLVATKSVRSKMKDMRQNMAEFEESEATYTSPRNNGHSKPETTSSSSKGDYIDFEEVK